MHSVYTDIVQVQPSYPDTAPLPDWADHFKSPISNVVFSVDCTCIGALLSSVLVNSRCIRYMWMAQYAEPFYSQIAPLDHRPLHWVAQTCKQAKYLTIAPSERIRSISRERLVHFLDPAKWHEHLGKPTLRQVQVDDGKSLHIVYKKG